MSLTLDQTAMDELALTASSIPQLDLKLYAIKHPDPALSKTLKKHLREIIGTAYTSLGSIVGDSADFWHVVETKKNLDSYDSDVAIRITSNYIHNISTDSAIESIEPDSDTGDTANVSHPPLSDFLTTELFLTMSDSYNSGLVEDYLKIYGDSGCSQHPELAAMYNTNNSRGFYIWNDDAFKWDSVAAVDINVKNYLAAYGPGAEDPVIDSDYIVTDENGNNWPLLTAASIGDYVPSSDPAPADSDSA